MSGPPSPSPPSPSPPRLLDRVREAIRTRHYSIRTEEAYVQWIVRLRVKDVDLGYNQILVRDGKGQKDRITVLPAALGIHILNSLLGHCIVFLKKPPRLACGFATREFQVLENCMLGITSCVLASTVAAWLGSRFLQVN